MSHHKDPVDVFDLTHGDFLTGTATIRFVTYLSNGVTPVLFLQFENEHAYMEVSLIPARSDRYSLRYGNRAYSRFTPHTEPMSGKPYVALTGVRMLGFGTLDDNDTTTAPAIGAHTMYTILSAPIMRRRLFRVTLMMVALNTSMVQDTGIIDLNAARTLVQEEIAQLSVGDRALLKRVACELGWEDPN